MYVVGGWGEQGSQEDSRRQNTVSATSKFYFLPTTKSDQDNKNWGKLQ